MQPPPASNESSRRTESFPDFVEQHFPTAYRFAFCLSLAHESAASLSEAAFAGARQARDSGTDGAIDKRWLLTALHRDWTRRGQISAVEQTKAADVSDREAISAKDAAQLSPDLILQTLHGMSLDHRLLLSLFYFEQLNPLEMAGILELSPAVALARFAEAKIDFRKQLERRRGFYRSARTPPVLAEGGPGE
ncbi:MAG: hypothetical protein M3Z64_08525 [Verrucomicrobiota bacterium]|nr:hypothetical protein [Verrucomicrobiota bacterium]